MALLRGEQHAAAAMSGGSSEEAAMAAAAAATMASSGGGGGAGGGGAGAAAVRSSSEEDLSAKALCKRYEGLVSVRSKAVKGKGAWYWTHLEPILVQNADTGLAKAVKLRCGLCNAMFSASNPSRTASEHLKRGTCPNFAGAVSRPQQAATSKQATTTTTSNNPPGSSRKRGHSSQQQQQQQQHLLASPTPLASIEGPQRILSGGKEDLGALAVLEDNVKKLRSPGGGIKSGGGGGVGGGGGGLSKAQSEAALNLLAEWLYESCGTVPFSCVEHPKFKAFLAQVGLPQVSSRHMSGSRLESKYQEVKHESEVKLRDAMFFQLSSDGWRKRRPGGGGGGGGRAAEGLVNITLNLPNGNSLFYRVVCVDSAPVFPSKAAEETLVEAMSDICGGEPHRCVGIVADSDKHTAKALQELEFKNRWMVNLACQAQAFQCLLKDFNKHLPIFTSVGTECLKIAYFFKLKAAASSCLQQYQRQEMDAVKAIRMPHDMVVAPQFAQVLAIPLPQVLALFEDVSRTARALQLVVTDESFKAMFGDDPHGREVSSVVMAKKFWFELEAVLSLVDLVKSKIQEVEADRPLVSQCIPLWGDFRGKVKEWCARFGMEEGHVEEVISKRYHKNYHPAWSAAFILDPLYLIRDSSGRYLPPYKCLSSEQEKDVDRLITRLVSRDEAHIVLMELMKWRSEGLDPLYAQAVQVKERDSNTGRMKAVNPQSRRLVWETCLSEFKLLGRVAVRLIFLHATSCSLRCNWSLLRWAFRNGISSSSSSSASKFAPEKAEKMIYIASHAKLERREHVQQTMNEDDKDAADMFNMNGDEDGMMSDEAFLSTAL